MHHLWMYIKVVLKGMKGKTICVDNIILVVLLAVTIIKQIKHYYFVAVIISNIRVS